MYDIVTSQCFVEGTLIVTDEGDKPIEEIQAGDLVYSTNPETGESEYKEVLRTFRKESDVLIHIFVNGEEIQTTPVHPFWVEDQWVAAKDLEAGDILTLADGTTAPITRTYGEKLDETVIVYNFEVSEFHTYYVTDTGVLVHNATQSLKGIGSCSVSSKNNSQKSKYKEFDVDTYENLTKPSSDNLSAHELLQNAWLEANGKINKRKTGISLQNPAMALREDPYHKAITAMQNHNKMNKNTLKGTSWQSNVHQNIKFMVQAGVPREKILELAKATIRFAKEHKL